MGTRSLVSALGAVLALAAAPAAHAALVPQMPVAADVWAQPVISQSPLGDSAAGWVSGGAFSVAVHHFGGGWETAQLSRADRTVGDGTVVADGWGTVIAVWSETQAGTTAVRVASHVRGQDWSPPVTVASGATVEAEVALTPSTITPVAAWVEGGAVRVLRGTSSGLRPVDWGTPQTISGPGAANLVAVDTGQRATVAWTDGADVLASAQDPSSGAWSAPATALAGATDPALASGFAFAGVTLVARTATGIVETTRQGAGAWTAPRTVSAAGAASYGAPALAVEPDGDAAAVWAQDGVQVVNRRVDGSWLGAQTLGAGPGRASVGITRSGRITAAWPTSDGTTIKRYITGTGWSGETTLGAPGDHDPLVAVPSPNGGAQDTDALIMWRTAADGLVARVDDLTAPRLEARSILWGTPVAGVPWRVFAVVADAWPEHATIHWSFGDGGTADGVQAEHTYPAAGPVVVSFTGEDAAGHGTAPIALPFGVAEQPGNPPPGAQVDPPVADPPAPAPAPGPTLAPTVTPAPLPPHVVLAATANRKLADVVRRGALRVRCDAAPGGACAVTATVDAATARRLGLRGRTLARGSAAAGRTAKLPLPRATVRKLRGVRRLTVKLTVVATAADGRRTSATATLIAKG